MTAVVRRPGGRSARIRRQVLEATHELLLERNLDSVTIPEVATHAGVHHTSIYRNWDDLGALLRDALLDLVTGVAPVPDTGDLESDLLALVDGIVTLYQTPIGKALLAATTSAEPALVEFGRSYWGARLASLGTVIDHAVERGELTPNTDRTLVFELILGPILSRQLLLNSGLEGLSSHDVVAALLPGLRGK